VSAPASSFAAQPPHRIGSAPIPGRLSTRKRATKRRSAIYRYTGGVPRLINTLCDTALLCAFAEQKTVIQEQDVLEAVAELEWKEHAGAIVEPSPVPRIVPKKHSNAVCRIEVRSQEGTLSEHTLPPGRVVVGRSPDNEIYIKSKFVSRHHAQIVCDDTACFIEDLNSTNGVFVDGQRVQKYQLRDGDVASLGVHDLVFSDLREAGDGSGTPVAKKRSQMS
jgi:hypothetical protein